MKKVMISLVMFLVVSGFVFGATFSEFSVMPVGTNEEKLAKIKVAENLLITDLVIAEKEGILSFLAIVERHFDKKKALGYANQLEILLGRKVTVKGLVLYEMVGKEAEAIIYLRELKTEGKALVYEIISANWYLYNIGKRTQNNSIAIEGATGIIDSVSGLVIKSEQKGFYGWIRTVLPTALKGLNVSEQVDLLVEASKNLETDIREELISLAVSKITTSDLSTISQVSLFLNCEKILSISDNADLISQIFSEISRKTGIKEVNELAVEKWIQENE